MKSFEGWLKVTRSATSRAYVANELFQQRFRDLVALCFEVWHHHAVVSRVCKVCKIIT